MRVAPLSRPFRRHSLKLPAARALDEESLKIGAAVAWIKQRGNLDDFPGSRTERMALMATAVRRGFVAWDRRHARYGLTQLGAKQAASYSPKVNVPSLDSAPLSNRFTGRLPAMMAAFLVIAGSVALAAVYKSGGSSCYRSSRNSVPASVQESSAPCAPVANTALSPNPGSAGATPNAQEHAKAVGEPTSPPQAAGPTVQRREEAANPKSASGPLAAQQLPKPLHAAPLGPQTQQGHDAFWQQTFDQSPPATQRLQKMDHSAIGPAPAAFAASGGDAAIDRSEHVAASDESTSTVKPADSPPAQATKLRSASHHRGHAKPAHSRVATESNSWRESRWPEYDDGGRLMFAPRAPGDPETGEASVDRGVRSYRQRRGERVIGARRPGYQRDEDRGPPRGAGDDPRGLVGWLFH
jgi:hypothetical protein